VSGGATPRWPLVLSTAALFAGLANPGRSRKNGNLRAANAESILAGSGLVLLSFSVT